MKKTEVKISPEANKAIVDLLKAYKRCMELETEYIDNILQIREGMDKVKDMLNEKGVIITKKRVFLKSLSLFDKKPDVEIKAVETPVKKRIVSKRVSKKKRICNYCGESFQPKGNRQEYCSVGCRNDSKLKKAEISPVEKSRFSEEYKKKLLQ